MVAAILVSSLFCGSSAAQQTIDLRNNVDFSIPDTEFTLSWTLSGTARVQNIALPGGFASELVLTDQMTNGSAGAASVTRAVLLNFNQPFTFQFHSFMYGSQGRGDGMTFVISSDPISVGGSGSDLGYGGQNVNSYAFAIDTFNFPGEPESPSIQILAGGSVPPIAVTGLGSVGNGVRNDFTWSTQVEFFPSGNDDEKGVLSGYIERPDHGWFQVVAEVDWSSILLESSIVALPGDEYVGRNVFFGFTAGNGAATDGHVITSINVVPEPETYALLLAGLGLVGYAARRRSARTPH